MRETLRHMQAFEYYYSLGSERSYRKVADHFDVSKASITAWARSHNWEQRVHDRDFENMREIRKQNDLETIKTMQNYRKVISGSISEYVKGLKNGTVKIENTNDFARLVRLDMQLCGFIEENIQEKSVDNYTINITLTGGET